MDNEKSKYMIRAFMGILILIAVIFLVYDFIKRTNSHIATGHYLRCQINCKRIGLALELYARKNNDFYPKELSIVVQKYLSDLPYINSYDENTNLKLLFVPPKNPSEIPACPGAKKDTYSSGYQVSRDFRSFTFYCEGHFHRKIGINENYPLYSSKTGFWMHQNCQDLLEPVNILKYAIEMKSANAVERLIHQNPSWIKMKNFRGETALFESISQNRQDVVLVLLENDADVNILSFHGETPLSYAIEKENQKIVNILVNYGAEIDDKILREAKQSGNRNIYEILLKKKQSKKRGAEK